MISCRLRNIFLISILGCLESMASLQGHSPDSLPALQAFTAAPSAVCLSKPSAPERHPNLLVLLMLAASSPCQLSRPPSSLPSRGQSVLGPPGGWKWPCPVPHPCTHQFPRMSPWAPPGGYPVLVNTEVPSLGLHLVQIIHGLFHSFHQFLLSTYDMPNPELGLGVSGGD